MKVITVEVAAGAIVCATVGPDGRISEAGDPTAPGLHAPCVFVSATNLREAKVDCLLESGYVVILIPGNILSKLAKNGDHDHEHRPSPQDIIAWDGLRIDLLDHRAYWQDQPLPLTDQELRMLASLAVARDQAVSYSRLCREVWSTNYVHSEESLRSAVKRLRCKLAHANASIRIEAVRGFGLRLSMDSKAPPQARRAGKK